MFRFFLLVVLALLLSRVAHAQKSARTAAIGVNYMIIPSNRTTPFGRPGLGPSLSFNYLKAHKKHLFGVELGYFMNRFGLELGPFKFSSDIPTSPDMAFTGTMVNYQFTSHNFNIGLVYGNQLTKNIALHWTLAVVAQQWNHRRTAVGSMPDLFKDREEIIFKPLPSANGLLKATLDYIVPLKNKKIIKLMPFVSINFIPVENIFIGYNNEKYFASSVGFSLGYGF